MVFDSNEEVRQYENMLADLECMLVTIEGEIMKSPWADADCG